MRVKLRALTIDDYTTTAKWMQEDEVHSLYLLTPYFHNSEKEKMWYQSILTSNVPVTAFGIELIEAKSLIGITQLRNIDLINRNAEFAIYLGDPNVRGLGYAEESTLLTLEFGFMKMGLNRIWLKVLEHNLSAIKLYRKCCFLDEGISRKAIYKDGRYWSLHIMSILMEEYLDKLGDDFE